MRFARTILLVLPILVGCGGGVQVILKSPVQDKCAQAGLQGCPEITQGVILYVEGDEAGGKDAVTKGAAQNTPAKVKKFARYVKQLKKIPGSGPYVQKLVEIADIMLAASKASAKPGQPGAPGGPDAEPLDPEDEDAVRIRR